MIYDCFTYFNEEELLKLRLLELSDVVDYFVITEGQQTFTGKDRHATFPKIKGLDQWEDQIIYQTFAFDDPELTAWERETAQRNALWDPRCDPNDILIFSDADEIPNPMWIEALRESPDVYVGPHQLDVTQYFWNYTWQVPQHCNQGARPVVSRGKDVTTPQQMRASSTLPRIADAGWHFSFFGHADASKFVNKVEGFSHTEVDQETFKDVELIKERARLGIDPFDRFPLKYVPIGKTHPRTLQARINT